MAWIPETPGSGRRSASPTVFEQQREELVREIAVVSTYLLSPEPSPLAFLRVFNIHTTTREWSRFSKT